MLANQEAINIIYTASGGDELLKLLPENPPEVILMDIQMPDMNGIDLCKQVHKQYRDIKIIGFSSFDDSHYIKQILRSGASGYVMKNADQQTIVKAIRTVMDGEEFIDESIKKILLQESITGQRRSLFEIPLTRREREILKMIAEENSNQEIADTLFISLRTVETHRLNITQKLGVKNAAGLVKEAMKRGLID